MDWMTTLMYILPSLLAGGGGTWLVSRRVKRAAVRKAVAEAKSLELENEEKTLKMQSEYIVKPLEGIVNNLTKEVRKLRLAINKIADCPYEAQCPVRSEIKKQEEVQHE